MAENKFFLKKGLWLGIILVVIHKILSIFPCYDIINNSFYACAVGVTFGLIVFLFILAENTSNLLITGFTGLFVLIGVEIILASTGFEEKLFGNSEEWLEIYFYGFLGSMIGMVIAIVCTLLKVKLNFFPEREDITMQKSLKIKLLIYTLLSAFGFTYLILPENAGISVPIFASLQFICLWFVVPNKKRLWLFIPIFVLAMNSLVSGNTMWRVPNVIISMVLYSVMFLDFDIKDTTSRFIVHIIQNIIKPILYYELPFRWTLDANKEKTPIIKRIVMALVITIPCLVILIITLSYADMVFSKGVSDFFSGIYKYINFNALLKAIYGVAAGLYLFGIVYSPYCKKDKETIKGNVRQGDLIILNILLASVLAIYTIFVVIQFKYLFAGASLPYGLTYTEYARKGFFELFALTGVNIAVILIAVNLTKENQSVWGNVTKWLCCYLCGITIVLLVSSFYRMWLYNADDGLTRLRFLVFGFLIFESIGLLLTFFYIFKPKFNIIAVYLSIGLLYYLLLNIVPMDYYVAKSQVDRYLSTGKAGIPYTITLSTDAAPQIERLFYSNDVDGETKNKVKYYFENQNKYYNSLVTRWQRYNISVNKTQQIYRRIMRDSFELKLSN